MRSFPSNALVRLVIPLLGLAILAAGCTPAATPTAAPTKAPAAAAPTTAPAAATAAKPAATAAAAPTTGAAAKPTGKAIKIGFISPLTGRAAAYGARQKITLQLGLDDVNASGGINGSPLEVTLVDDAADPQQAVTMVRRLANDDKLPVILGPLTSASFEVAAPLANDLKVPLATTTSTKPGITDQNRPWVFRFAALDAVMTPKAIEGYKKLYPNAKRLVIAGDTKESVNSNNIKVIYPAALKDAGLTVIDTVAFDTGVVDFAAIVTKIKDLKPEGIAYSSLTPEAVGFAKELQKQGVTVPVVAGLQNWGGPEVILAQTAMEGWVSAGTFDEDASDALSKSVTQRFAKIGEADPAVGKPAYVGNWANAYDGVVAVAQIMRNAKITPDTDLQTARAAIRDGLQSLKGFKGLLGDETMQPNGDITTNRMAFVAKNSKWVLIK